ncbi:MAG TPA: hypothetical protein VK419_16120, partial [Bryobacteraceae bacterium]|nr:hypothetical protein [Bryobacteraceae bacterium]
MSRFARLHGVQFRVWSPPGSPVRIEYSSALLRQVHIEAAHGDALGTLFGIRIDGGFRVVAARVSTGEDAHKNDPLLAGLEPVGIFAARVRGEVFLTESDLERLENRAVALVVAGENAGFFVREADGSIQAIQSYQEFPAPRPAQLRKPGPRKPDTWKPDTWKPDTWKPGPRKLRLVPAVLATCASVAVLWGAFLVPRRSAPIALAVHAEDGQLRIAWNRAGRGSLEITDGDERSAISVSPDLASVTYAPRTGDVRIELRRNDGQHEETRFIGDGDSRIRR